MGDEIIFTPEGWWPEERPEPEPDEPYSEHWSESYTEPSEDDDEFGDWDMPEEVTANYPEFHAAKITMLHKNACQLCGHYPLLPPWNEGDPVKCPNCGARSATFDRHTGGEKE